MQPLWHNVVEEVNASTELAMIKIKTFRCLVDNGSF